MLQLLDSMINYGIILIGISTSVYVAINTKNI